MDVWVTTIDLLIENDSWKKDPLEMDFDFMEKDKTVIKIKYGVNEFYNKRFLENLIINYNILFDYGVNCSKLGHTKNLEKVKLFMKSWGSFLIKNKIKLQSNKKFNSGGLF